MIIISLFTKPCATSSTLKVVHMPAKNRKIRQSGKKNLHPLRLEARTPAANSLRNGCVSLTTAWKLVCTYVVEVQSACLHFMIWFNHATEHPRFLKKWGFKRGMSQNMIGHVTSKYTLLNRMRGKVPPDFTYAKSLALHFKK